MSKIRKATAFARSISPSVMEDRKEYLKMGRRRGFGKKPFDWFEFWLKATPIAVLVFGVVVVLLLKVTGVTK